MDLDLELEITN